jgi:hypothetical protein
MRKAEKKGYDYYKDIKTKINSKAEIFKIFL